MVETWLHLQFGARMRAIRQACRTVGLGYELLSGRESIINATVRDAHVADKRSMIGYEGMVFDFGRTVDSLGK